MLKFNRPEQDYWSGLYKIIHMKQKIAFALLMGIVTTGIISFTLISVNLGFTDKFTKIWLKSWAMAYVVAIPAILVIAPQIEKLVAYLFTPKKSNNEPR